MRLKWVIPSILALAAVGAGAYWSYRWWAVEQELLAQAPYVALKEHERDEYRVALKAFRGWHSGDLTEAAFIDASSAAFSKGATKRLARASQESLLALMKDSLVTARRIQQKSPDNCFRYWHPDVAGAAEVSQVLSPEERRHTLEIMAEVIRTGAEKPVQVPTAEEVQEPLAAVVNDIYAAYGTDAQMVAHADDPRIDRGKVCEITNAFYQRIMAWPPETSSKLIRVMAAPTSVQSAQ